MIYSGKENIPLLMFLRGDGPAAGERFIQQFKAGHAQNGKFTPVWETAAAALACGLIREEIHDPFLNAIILRLHDSRFIVIGKAQQAFLMNGCQDKIMNSRIHGSRRWVPYYAE
jgi:hypothetical protein